jgi:hypothetical protein
MKLIRVTSAAGAFLLFGTMAPLFAQHEQQADKQEKAQKQDRSEKQARPAQPQQPKERTQPQQRAQQPQPQQQQPKERAQPQQRAQQPQPQQPQQPKERTQPQQRAQQPQQQPQRAPQQQRAQQGQSQPQQAQQQQPQRTQQQAQTYQQQRGFLKQGGGWQAHDSWQQSRAQNWSNDHRTWAQRGGYGGFYVPQDRFVISFGTQHSFRIRSRPAMYQGYPRFEYGGYSFLMVDPWPEYWADNWYATDDVYIDYDNGYYLYDRSYPQVRLAIMVSL